MTALLAFSLVVQGFPNGATVLAPEGARNTIQVVVRLPALRPTERLTLLAAARSAVRRTREYGRGSVRAIASGGTLARLGEDGLRLGLSFAPGDEARALALLESMLVRPVFLPEALADDAAGASARPASPWDAALAPVVAPLATVTPEAAEAIWTRLVRPEALTIAFGSAEVAGAWSRRAIVWPRPAPEGYFRTEAEPARIGAARVVALEGPPLPEGADLGMPLLAAVALGAGKGSLGWRVLRLERARSYRVEGALVGVLGGWRARVAFDLAPEEDAGEARAALAEAVSGLGEADLARAKGYLDAALRGEAYDDVLLPGGRRLDGSPEDAAFLAAYLAMKRAAPPRVPWDATLEELKAACAELLARAEARG